MSDESTGAQPETLDQKRAKWKKQYGEILECKLGKTECIFRPADQGEWERLQDKISDDKNPSSYLRSTAQQVLLHPSREEFEALLERYPAFPDTLCSKLRELGGGKVEMY